MGDELKELGGIATMVKESASAFAKAVEDNHSAQDNFLAAFKEAMPKSETKVAETTDVALVNEGVLAGVTKTDVFGVPIGKIAVGTFGGVFISELVDGFLAKQGTMVQGGVKLAMAGVTAKWGRKWLGSDVAYAIAFVLGVFGLSQVLPIDKWATSAAGTVKGFLPGTIKVAGMDKVANVNNQADQVLAAYRGIARRVG